MKSIIGLDPGSEKSAYVWWDGKAIMDRGIYPNEEILELLEGLYTKWREPIILAIETMVSIPGGGGKSIVDTIFWSGQFYNEWHGEKAKVPVHVVRKALGGKDDPGIRAALIVKFGEPGSAKNPNLITYQLRGQGYHLWRAFAVCVFYMDHLKFQDRVLK